MGGMFRDFLRAYKLLVDGEVRGRVRPRKTIGVEIEPGPHEVQMKIDWAGSESHKVDLRPGETARFVCWANTGTSGQLPEDPQTMAAEQAAGNIGAITVGKDQYIGFAPVSDPSESPDRGQMGS